MYDSFAKTYDFFMDNVDYRAWAGFIRGVLSRYGIRDGLLLDLACGTGTLTELLSRAGYDCIGVDASPDMLQEALRKRDESGSDILYLEQDMTSFELYGTVRAVVCACDSINYLLNEEDLVQTFRLVNNYLDPEGILLFDFNTENVYAPIGSETIAENRDDGSFIWENEFDPATRINEIFLTLFTPAGGTGLYEKSEETHIQRAWSLREIQGALKEAGLLFEAAFENYTDTPAGPDSGRITVIAKEHGKSRGASGPA